MVDGVDVAEAEGVVQRDRRSCALAQPAQLPHDQLHQHRDHPRANGEVRPAQAEHDPAQRHGQQPAQHHGQQHGGQRVQRSDEHPRRKAVGQRDGLAQTGHRVDLRPVLPDRLIGAQGEVQEGIGAETDEGLLPHRNQPGVAREQVPQRGQRQQHQELPRPLHGQRVAQQRQAGSQHPGGKEHQQRDGAGGGVLADLQPGMGGWLGRLGHLANPCPGGRARAGAATG